MKAVNPRNVERIFRVFIIVVCLTFPTVLSLPLYGGKRYIRSSIYYPQRGLQWTPLPFAAYQPRVTRYYSPYSQDYSVEDYYPQSAYYYQPNIEADSSNYSPYYYVDRPSAGYYSYEQDPYEDPEGKFDDYDFAERAPSRQSKSPHGQRQWFDDGMADNSEANERFVQNLMDSQMFGSDGNSGTVIFAPAQSSRATGSSRRDEDSSHVTYGTKKLSKYDDSDEEEEVRELKSLIHDQKKSPKKVHDHSADEPDVYIAEKYGVFNLPQTNYRGNGDWGSPMRKKNALKPLPPLSRAHPDLFIEPETVHHVSDRKLNMFGHTTGSSVSSSVEATTTPVLSPVKKGQKEVVLQQRPAAPATSSSSSEYQQRLGLSRAHNQNPSVIDTIKSLLSLEDNLNKVRFHFNYPINQSPVDIPNTFLYIDK